MYIVLNFDGEHNVGLLQANLTGIDMHKLYDNPVGSN